MMHSKGSQPMPLRAWAAAVAIILFLSSSIGHAAFSEFVRITPKNEPEHGIHVTVISLENGKNQYVFKVPLTTAGKSAWLILCKKELLPEKQNFREYIWSAARKGGEDILMVTRIQSNDDGPQSGDKDKEKYAEVLLHKSIIDRAYIYIDYPSPIFDGGFYYSIDLMSYMSEVK